MLQDERAASTDASSQELAGSEAVGAPVGGESAGADVADAAQAARLAIVALPGGATFAGQVDADGVPDGLGVLTTPFGSVYAGWVRGGAKDGVGVETAASGSTYAGEFLRGLPDGYGVHTSAVGDKYAGQWREGSRHGVGLCMDPDARAALGWFAMDEPESRVEGEELDGQPFDQVERAFSAEARALCSQEAARANEVSATLLADCSVDGHELHSPEDVERLEAAAQAELDALVRAQDAETAELAAAASALEQQEARLAQRQTQLRQELSARAAELAQLARFGPAAAARQAEARDARRVLGMLHRQCEELRGKLANERSVDPFINQ